MRLAAALALAALAVTILAAASSAAWVTEVHNCNATLAVYAAGGHISMVCSNGTATFTVVMNATSGRVEKGFVAPCCSEVARLGDNVVVAACRNRFMVMNLTVKKATILVLNMSVETVAYPPAAAGGDTIFIPNVTACRIPGAKILAVVRNDDMVYVGGELDGDAFIAAINVTRCSVEWAFKVATPHPDWVADITFDGNVVYAAGAAGFPPLPLVIAVTRDGKPLYAEAVFVKGMPATAQSITKLDSTILVAASATGYTLVFVIDAASGKPHRVYITTGAMITRAKMHGRFLPLVSGGKSIVVHIYTDRNITIGPIKMKIGRHVAVARLALEPLNLTAESTVVNVEDVETTNVTETSVSATSYGSAETGTGTELPSPTLIAILAAAGIAAASIYALKRLDIARILKREHGFVVPRG